MSGLRRDPRTARSGAFPASAGCSRARRRRQAARRASESAPNSVYRLPGVRLRQSETRHVPPTDLRAAARYVQLVRGALRGAGARAPPRRCRLEPPAAAQDVRPRRPATGCRRASAELDAGARRRRRARLARAARPGAGAGNASRVIPESLTRRQDDYPKPITARRDPARRHRCSHQREFAASSPIVRSGLSRARASVQSLCHYAVGAEAARTPDHPLLTKRGGRRPVSDVRKRGSRRSRTALLRQQAMSLC